MAYDNAKRNMNTPPKEEEDDIEQRSPHNYDRDDDEDDAAMADYEQHVLAQSGSRKMDDDRPEVEDQDNEGEE